MLRQSSGLLIIAALFVARSAFAQIMLGPEQYAPSHGGGGTVAGYNNTPQVVASGGNATSTLLTKCSSPGCTDYEYLSNGSNTGTLTITCSPASLMTQGEYLTVYVSDTGTAPSDILFANCSGVTYKGGQPGLSANNIIGTTAGDKTARANSCGVPPATGNPFYNFFFDGSSLFLTGCTGHPSASFISPALVGGAQWQSRTVTGGPLTDPVLASDTLIVDDTTSGDITETLPACIAAGSAGANPGKFYIFKKKDTTSGHILLTPNGTDQIDTAGASVVVTIGAGQTPSPQVEYPIQCSPAGGAWLRGLPIPWAHGAGGTDVTSVGSAGQYLTSTGVNFAVQSRPLRPGFDFGSPTSNLYRSYPLTEQAVFPIDFGASGSPVFPDVLSTISKCATSPSETDTYNVACDTTVGSAACGGTVLGTVAISTSCVATFATTSHLSQSCAAGNTLRVCAPGTVSGAGVAITLAGHWAP